MKKISFGIYKGVGDFLGAVLAARAAPSEIEIFIFVYGTVDSVCTIPLPDNIKICNLGKNGKINFSIALNFLISILKIRPDTHIISDFSGNTSFNVSKTLQILTCLFLKVKALGTCSDFFSYFYKSKLPTTENIELIRKDYYHLSHIIKVRSFNEITDKISKNIPVPRKIFKYVFHIGASTYNKRLPPLKLLLLINKLRTLDICFIGLESDFTNFDSNFPNVNYRYQTTEFIEMLSLIKYCQVFIGFDSAAANFANLFKRRIHIISGPANSEFLYQKSNSIIIHRSDSSCQKCGLGKCVRQNVECMDYFNIDQLSIAATANSPNN